MGLVEYKGLVLGLLKSAFNAENFTCRLSSSISSHFGAIHFCNVSQLEITKKSLKFSIFGGSRSLMLTSLKSSLPALVMISSMSVPICNHFNARQANSSNITSLLSSFAGTPSPSGVNFCHEILETLGYHMVVSEVSISPGVESVPHRDRQTGR